MTLSAGMRLGPYEVERLLGAGGMGEVYKAHDTRLDRTVAVKVLHDSIAATPDRRTRFEREARTIASLSHPHICTLFDVGEYGSALFLVMEYLAGETLADRLARGPVPIDEALDVAVQIADALSAAHRAGIVHRDLKPGNIMLTASGVKLLDFGLAKAAGGTGDLGSLPTMPADLTAQGTILGTVQYMAPEQLEGRQLDARTDIFAFGAVLYEIVTGTRAFGGKSQASVIGAIMHAEPAAMSTVREQVPPVLDHIVSRCLAKNPDERWQAASDVMRELKWIAADGVRSLDGQRAPKYGRAGWRRAAIVASLLVVLLAVLLAYVVSRPPDRDARTADMPIRFSVFPPAGTRLTAVQFALSPDGSTLAYIGLAAEERQIWLYSLATGDSHRVEGVTDAHFPFWSPDGQHIGYTSPRGLMRVDVHGGLPQALVPASTLSSGAWGDGFILFAGREATGIFRVPAAGGSPVAVTSLDAAGGEEMHLQPRLLPGGKRFTYFVRSRNSENTGVYVRSLDADDHKLLGRAAGQAEYTPPGYLLFVRDAVLYAQRFDLGRSDLQGELVPIAQPVSANSDNGGAAVSVSRDGSLAYQARADAPGTLEWVDRHGKLGTVVSPRGVYRSAELAPDDRTVLAKVRGRDVSLMGDLWTIDLARGVSSRLTTNAASLNARWSPDGQYVVFDSQRAGAEGVYRKRADGTGAEELLWRTHATLADIDPDGNLLIDDGHSCAVVHSGAAQATRILIDSPSLASCGRLSNDGRYLAYTLTDSGRSDVYVVPYPAGTPRIQVSSTGGREPRWRRDGRELFYLAPDGGVMSVSFARTDGLNASSPQHLFQAIALTSGPFAPYGVSSDGQRFLMIDPFEDPRAESFTVIAHWAASLR